MRFFDKSKGVKTLRDKYRYIKEHYRYYIMNSWNRLQSLANNVKIHHLPLTKEQIDRWWTIYSDDELCRDMYIHINNILYDFERENPEFELFFNGRSGGYLVLKSAYNNDNLIDEHILDTESYEEMIEYYREYNGYSYLDSRRECNRVINECYEYALLLDRVSDEILTELVYILDNSTIAEYEELKTIKHKELVLDEWN